LWTRRWPDSNHQFRQEAVGAFANFPGAAYFGCSGYRGLHTHLGAVAAMVQPFFFSASNHSIEPGWGTV